MGSKCVDDADPILDIGGHERSTTQTKKSRFSQKCRIYWLSNIDGLRRTEPKRPLGLFKRNAQGVEDLVRLFALVYDNPRLLVVLSIAFVFEPLLQTLD